MRVDGNIREYLKSYNRQQDTNNDCLRYPIQESGNIEDAILLSYKVYFGEQLIEVSIDLKPWGKTLSLWMIITQ